ncbi:MAG: HAMP domain-containing sensor histidine kinase [bacterium]|nr:HAMP domain-containing sensor histidine kinase [bacterium]
MNTKKVYDFTIIVLMFFGLIWFVGFYLLYMNFSIVLEKYYTGKADYIFSCYSKCNKCDAIYDNDLIYIAEYDKENFNDNTFLYVKEGYRKEDLLKYRNSFQYQASANPSKNILIVFSDMSSFFHYIIAFSLILGTGLFLSVIFFFYTQKTKRNRDMQSLIDFVSGEMKPDKESFADDDVMELYDAVLKCVEKYDANEENQNKLIKILQTENNTLKNKDMMKTGVIENISHELKSPMTKIKGYLDYLYSERMGELKETQKDALVVVRKNVDNLLSQIDQIIKYAKDESFQLEKEIFDVKKLISQIILVHLKEAEEKSISIEHDIDNLKDPILGDRAALQEVFDNLTVNALKFTDKNGKIRITGYERMENNVLNAVIKVEDTGIGIPHDKLEKIFDRFYQVEQERSKKYPGMGLGLTIAKIIIEAHGGSISVSSVIGRGSTFKVVLPIKKIGGEFEANT